MLGDAIEPLSGNGAVCTGHVREADRHDLVDQRHQRGVEHGRIGWTKIGSPSPVLSLVGPEPEPVHTGNYLLFCARRSIVLGHVTVHRRKISATPVEKSVGIGCSCSGERANLRNGYVFVVRRTQPCASRGVHVRQC